MKKKRYIIAFLACLSFSTISAQPQHNVKQEYIYHTDDQRIKKAINYVCRDHLNDTLIVRQAILSYLNNNKNMEKNWNGMRTELRDAKNEAENLEKQIHSINKRILELSDVDKDNIKQRWTSGQLDSLRKELEGSLSDKRKKQNEINESNLYVTRYNKWVQAQNKYMANHKPSIEKSLDYLLEEANKLMEGKYSFVQNNALVKELQDRFNKDKRAKKAIELLERQEKAKKFLTAVCDDLRNYIDYQDIDYLRERQRTYNTSYNDSYKMFNEAFKRLESELEKKRLTVEKVDRILNEVIENE